jgi:hypothetical protein
MAEKCRKAKGATLERCEAAQYAITRWMPLPLPPEDA